MKKNIIKALRNLKDGEGLTLKNWNIITYKTGWQVADNGVDTPELLNAYMAIASYHGTCGVWLENGTYYIDHSFRVNTKREALEVGRAHRQISVYGWKLGNLAYC